MRYLGRAREVISDQNVVPEKLSWTEEVLIVEQANFLSEKLTDGKTAISLRLELAGDPQSSSNLRKRPEIQLVFGLEEKDSPTFLRLLGRKVFLLQEREESSLEREDLLEQLSWYKNELELAQHKVKYLNDSLHHYVEGSRSFPGEKS